MLAYLVSHFMSYFVPHWSYRLLLLLLDMLMYVVLADGAVCPCLWVGTSLGSILVVAFGMPADGGRNTEPVSVMPSGMLLLSLSFRSQWMAA